MPLTENFTQEPCSVTDSTDELFFLFPVLDHVDLAEHEHGVGEHEAVPHYNQGQVQLHGLARHVGKAGDIRHIHYAGKLKEL